jgi:hypothetical protein
MAAHANNLPPPAFLAIDLQRAPESGAIPE